MRPDELPSAINTLRLATKDRHEALEAVVNLERIASSRAAYISILGQFLGAWEPMETAINASVSQFGEVNRFEPEMRAHLLVSDLRNLGASQRKIDKLPRVELNFALDSTAALAGVLYVTGGSALGGQMICRRVREIDITPENGGAFFYGSGKNTPSNWRKLCQWLEETLNSEDARQSAVATAAATFEMLNDWFEK